MSDKSSKFRTGAVNPNRTSSITVLLGENAGSDSSKKRYAKAADKDDMRSEHSGKTNQTSKSGRFEAKYKVGDNTASGAIIKEVREEDWQLIEKDKKGNCYYKCSGCVNAIKVRKDHRKTHTCK